MADFSMYHNLGDGAVPEDERLKSHIRTEPAAPQFVPPVAHPPSGYVQSGGVAPSPQQAYHHQHGFTQSPPYPSPSVGYPSPQGYPQAPVDMQSGVNNLTAQMGGLGIAGGAPTPPAGGSVRAHKKKDRHAYHDIGAPAGSSRAFNGMPPGSTQQPSQFLNQQSPQVASPHGGLASPQMQQQPGAARAIGDGSVPTQGRVDPEQIPSVPRSRDVPAQYYLEHTYPTMERHVPPPSTVPFVAHDQGNSSPKFARLTINNIPSTAESLASTSLPLGLILQPFAPLDDAEQPVPVLDFGDAGPPRCRRCRAYINPFMIFRSGGNKFICNMCTFPNDVSPEYYAPLDPSGVRVDRIHRPELMQGTVEFLVPKEYWSKEPVGLRWLFLLDVSQEAVSRGFLEACCDGLLSALYGSNKDGDEHEAETTEDGESKPRRNLPEGAKVGIITFDKEVHFYNLSPQLEQAQMIVMPDLEDPFVPLSEGLFADPYESKHVISSLLTQIPTLFSFIKYPEPALLPTLNSALCALESTGGKIVCSLSSLPTWGPGRLFMRDKGTGPGTDAERKLFITEHVEWKKAATKAAESGIGIDFFIAAGGGTYMDIATIGYQVLLKVRCSNGLQISSYHGNFLQHTFASDLEMGSIDADKAFGIMFTYDGKLDPKLDAHFQAALLYTAGNGQRRVRCINIVAAVNDGGMETMKSLDQDAIVSILAKEAASKVPEKSLTEIRAGLTEKSIDILASYRKNFSLSHPPGQLVLPEYIQEFSMYMLSLLKSRAFKGGHEPSDRRIHDVRMLRSFGCRELSLYLYPRIIPIHNLDPKDGFSNEHGQLQVPPSQRASFSRIEDGGVYIVDNGQICILWIHALVSPNLLEDLFGPGHTTLKSLDPNTSSIPVLETQLNAQVRNILQYLSTIRGSKAMTIQLARQGIDGSEYEFARLLLEDRNNEAHSYVDWLVHLHRQINIELGGHRKKDDGSTVTGAVGAGVEKLVTYPADVFFCNGIIHEDPSTAPTKYAGANSSP
ncbi:Sec23/Sec24 family protein [Microsporum canis CBS 113480]|uniref:Sec23/Sec24 family protein n=1 Tax=Arthroderma otae (strain ATCC MYA-4605 / CBS 113480) TaxID=554155 RepID=C5FLM3_ARTOC|nr:Sec23/Sec24 family protein [Microsporum canis CBS 113480]EEQ30595.1 Sec23/Sec24 family protein [Microsporum canis CBS 113480]